MAKKQQSLHPDEPLKHPDHPRPVTRRDFIRQGFMTGGAMVAGNALFNLFLHPEQAHALSADVGGMNTGPNCVVGAGGALKIPFITFDLGGGANLAGSNAVVGGQGGQMDISAVGTAGYSRLGIPGDRLPGLPDGNGGDFTNNTLGLVFHSESALLAGILDKISPGCAAGVNGAIIPARSDNDTGNNPHNPMYGIARTGARGSLLTLIGSVSSDSGARSLSPAAYINPEIRPTKVDRPSDVTGLVDTGELLSILNQADAVRVMEAVARISNAKIGGVTGFSDSSANTALQQLLRCGYVKAADVAEQFADPQAINPEADVNIKGANGIFTDAEFDGDGEFRKTASVMKLVINTLAGAGSITMGGYDYHTGDRTTGERRDIRAGRCIGACLEYAHRRGLPLMVYVYSDGSVFSNGTPDMNGVTDGGITLPGGKGVWTGDNSSTAASIILIYHPDPSFTFNSGAPLTTPPPGIRTAVRGADANAQARRQQLGYFRNNGALETSPRTPGGFPILAATNVERLVDTVLLNYMALHYNTQSAGIGQLLTDFNAAFPNHGLGSNAALDELIIFNGMVNGQITSRL